ncbi:uncharacterized protein LOC133292177 [Gastrolobium bilobum]|uniref:uncharacterized protein LOC133292177 n=1 Tax=Gastrolobium bilobum TaxID=150636 RepID=UPI002AB20115|nr:uncharacterized protein LOC133292177 [Gastrolobium bilobum]
MSPFQTVYGKCPTLIPHYNKEDVKLEAVDTMLQDREVVINQLKMQLQRAQQGMKDKTDRHRQERMFNVGDKVLIKLQPYRQISVARRANHKLAKRYFGPFIVEQVISSVAYKVTLPEGSLIHPVFHVSLLKPFHGSSDISHESLPVRRVDSKPLQVPVAILASRQHTSCGEVGLQYLVQWSASVPENASWENAKELCQAYPHLENKVAVQGRAVDTGSTTLKGRPCRIKGFPSWAIDHAQ